MVCTHGCGSPSATVNNLGTYSLTDFKESTALAGLRVTITTAHTATQSSMVRSNILDANSGDLNIDLLSSGATLEGDLSSVSANVGNSFRWRQYRRGPLSSSILTPERRYQHRL